MNEVTQSQVLLSRPSLNALHSQLSINQQRSEIGFSLLGMVVEYYISKESDTHVGP